MVELAGDTNRVRQVVVAYPENVHSINGGNLLDVRDAVGGLYLGDQERLVVGMLHTRDHIFGGLVVVVTDAEGRTALALRRVFSRGDDGAGLLRGLYHGHHDAGS